MITPGTKILYWSRRRIGAVAEGHHIDLAPHAATEVSSPRWSLLPTISRRGSLRPLTLNEQLQRVEQGLGGRIERSFDQPLESPFLGARTTVSFAWMERNPNPSRAAMFAEVRSGSRPPVAVCLFGSMDNFSEFLRDAEAPLREGWTSSSLNSVIKYLAGRCAVLPTGVSAQYAIAIEALKIAAYEGNHWERPHTRDRPWHRAFTFADVPQVADWVAEIYADVDLVAETGCTYDGYGRILIGAPLWITTPYLSSVRLYEDYERSELDAATGRFGRLSAWAGRRREKRTAGFKKI